MNGDHWRKLAGLRLLFAYQWTMPGKKLLFMGGEFGQTREWNHDTGLDWHLLQKPDHSGVQKWVKDLNTLYRINPALHERDHQPDGFSWIDCNDADASVYSYFRKNKKGDEIVVAILNFTPIVRNNYRIGVPGGGYWREVLNSDAVCYGGSNVGNGGGAQAEALPYHGQPYSINLTLPPLGAVLFHGHM
jgi:1,4-alpha-glucan branching enzyme